MFLPVEDAGTRDAVRCMLFIHYYTIGSVTNGSYAIFAPTCNIERLEPGLDLPRSYYGE